MKTFCVTTFNQFDGALSQIIVYAESYEEAIFNELKSKGWDVSECPKPGCDEFEDWCAGCGIWVIATELTNVKIL